MDNPFDLAKHQNVEKLEKKIDKDKLKGYMVVPNKYWGELPYGATISYKKKDGTIVKGGYVFKTVISKEGKMYIGVQNNKNTKSPNHSAWMVDLENVSEIYKKPNPQIDLEIKIMRDHLVMLEKQISTIKQKIPN